MINAEVDYKKWFYQWEVNQRKVFKVSKETIAGVATSLYTKIISYTPVGDPSLWKYPATAGYQPGTLKRNWFLKSNADDSVWTIWNPTVYGVRVEYGWSTQAPYGMMRRGIADFPDLLAQAAKRFKF